MGKGSISIVRSIWHARAVTYHCVVDVQIGSTDLGLTITGSRLKVLRKEESELSSDFMITKTFYPVYRISNALVVPPVRVRLEV